MSKKIIGKKYLLGGLALLLAGGATATTIVLLKNDDSDSKNKKQTNYIWPANVANAVANGTLLRDGNEFYSSEQSFLTHKHWTKTSGGYLSADGTTFYPDLASAGIVSASIDANTTSFKILENGAEENYTRFDHLSGGDLDTPAFFDVSQHPTTATSTPTTNPLASTLKEQGGKLYTTEDKALTAAGYGSLSSISQSSGAVTIDGTTYTFAKEKEQFQDSSGNDMTQTGDYYKVPAGYVSTSNPVIPSMDGYSATATEYSPSDIVAAGQKGDSALIDGTSYIFYGNGDEFNVNGDIDLSTQTAKEQFAKMFAGDKRDLVLDANSLPVNNLNGTYYKDASGNYLDTGSHNAQNGYVGYSATGNSASIFSIYNIVATGNKDLEINSQQYKLSDVQWIDGKGNKYQDKHDLYDKILEDTITFEKADGTSTTLKLSDLIQVTNNDYYEVSVELSDGSTGLFSIDPSKMPNLEYGKFAWFDDGFTQGYQDSDGNPISAEASKAFLDAIKNSSVIIQDGGGAISGIKDILSSLSTFDDVYANTYQTEYTISSRLVTGFHIVSANEDPNLPQEVKDLIAELTQSYTTGTGTTVVQAASPQSSANLEDAINKYLQQIRDKITTDYDADHRYTLTGDAIDYVSSPAAFGHAIGSSEHVLHDSADANVLLQGTYYKNADGSYTESSNPPTPTMVGYKAGVAVAKTYDITEILASETSFNIDGTPYTKTNAYKYGGKFYTDIDALITEIKKDPKAYKVASVDGFYNAISGQILSTGTFYKEATTSTNIDSYVGKAQAGTDMTKYAGAVISATKTTAADIIAAKADVNIDGTDYIHTTIPAGFYDANGNKAPAVTYAKGTNYFTTKAKAVAAAQITNVDTTTAQFKTDKGTSQFTVDIGSSPIKYIWKDKFIGVALSDANKGFYKTHPAADDGAGKLDISSLLFKYTNSAGEEIFFTTEAAADTYSGIQANTKNDVIINAAGDFEGFVSDILTAVTEADLPDANVIESIVVDGVAVDRIEDTNSPITNPSKIY